MSDKLVIVATFSTPTEASIVRNQLESDGIRTFLADDAIVGMAWHLGAAVGGIKLQVAGHDAERAAAILEANDAAPITEDAWRPDENDDTSDAGIDHAEEGEADSPTDEIVARAFRAAVFGLLFLPLQLYSLWLLLRIAFNSTPMSAANRRKVQFTLIIDLLIICLLVLWAMFSA